MITFATSNDGKFKRFCQELHPFGLTARQQPLDIAEPQEISIPDVARHKAQQAYLLINGPVVVEDSGLCIHGLNNFPEALTKPVLSRVGLPGLLQMLDSLADRRCHFISALGYADVNGTVDVIASTHERGTLLRAPQGELHDEAWSTLSYIFVPDGCDCSMAAMDRAALDGLYARWRPDNVFAAFASLAAVTPARFESQKAA